MKLNKWLDKNCDASKWIESDMAILHVLGTSREEAEKFINDQFKDNTCFKEKYRKPEAPGPGAHHYGKCELKDLLDLIYGKEAK